ncbi:hypothetical protein GCM10018785_45160 [Streptomyces longispororuber]|uniref:Uncharacterized protein n=2 Tax=Streptomyces longispororuber TaxID=68230 RepID=A0A918ZV13_9ACTN|nr:hypothetical protein GCM10018785_45160 [Streptomyces longispororuber]
MSPDQYQFRSQGHGVSLASGCEAIMPFSTAFETADDFSVTARGAFFIALLVLPLIAISGTASPLALTLVTVAAAAGQSTYVVYRRVRRM